MCIMKNKKNLIKIAISIFIVLLSILSFKKASFESVREMVSQFGAFSEIAYIVIFTVLPIFFFPVPILVLVGGVLFGISKGFLYTMAACFLNCTVMYFLGKFLGRDFYNFLTSKVSPDLNKKLQTSNQKSLTYLFFILRLVPLVSYNLINYVAGFTKIKYSNYMAVSMIGIIPGMIVFLNTGDKSVDIGSFEFIISIVLIVVLVVISTVLAKIYLDRSSNGFDNNSDL